MSVNNPQTREWQTLSGEHHLAPFSDYKQLKDKGPRIITKAQGVHLWDSEGHKILDGMAGLWCVAVGYGREELVQAAEKQMRELPYYNLFFQTAHPPALELAKAITDVAPEGMTHVFFTGSGSEGNDTVLIAGTFSFEESDADLLLDSLPTFLLIPSRNASATVVRSTLAILDIEIKGTQIGAAVLTDRLVDILLVQVLRAALIQDDGDNLGWISALADPRIGRAIGLMHGNAAYPWSLETLAASVAMSRSAFSKRFKSLVGLAPLDYLLRWRMRLARNALRRGSTVATVASEVGYSSESAFGHAFKRIYGIAPRRYWRTVEP